MHFHLTVTFALLESMAAAAVRYATKQIQCTFPVANVLLISMGRGPVNAFNDALWFELRDHFRAAVSLNASLYALRAPLFDSG